MQCGIANTRPFICLVIKPRGAAIVPNRDMRLLPISSAGFGVGNDGLFQHFEHGRRVLIAQTHRQRVRVDRLGQRKQRGCAAKVAGS